MQEINGAALDASYHQESKIAATKAVRALVPKRELEPLWGAIAFTRHSFSFKSPCVIGNLRLVSILEVR